MDKTDPDEILFSHPPVVVSPNVPTTPNLQLSLLIEGPGTEPDAPSHWSLALHPSTSTLCTLLNVIALNSEDTPRARHVFGFDRRDGHEFLNNDSKGRVLLASNLSGIQYKKISKIIEDQPPPVNANGEGEHCQHWVVNCLVDLEVEELIEAGLTELVGALIGKSAEVVKEVTGKKGIWVEHPETRHDKVFVHTFL